ncbi:MULTISPECIES: hypothetical protein [unclassified Geodermatophilus]
MIGPVAVRALAVRALAVGAVALGSAAVGGLAVGSLTVGRLAAGRVAVARTDLRTVRVARLEIDEFVVGRTSGLPTTPGAAEASPVEADAAGNGAGRLAT